MVLITGSVLGASPAGADTVDPIVASRQLLASPVARDGSRIVELAVEDDHKLMLRVHSTAMDKTIALDVQRPADASVPRPTLYLLDGATGGQDDATWRSRAPETVQFLSEKNTNVVTPIGGAASYYADWRSPDPALGVNKWKTFLAEELPPLIDAALGTSGRNAIAGISMSGTSVLQLAEAEPDLYRSVAAYSGCAQISDPLGYTAVNSVLLWSTGIPGNGGASSANMYGPWGDPMWADNDPYLHADRLRGLDLFVSSGSGLPGRWDNLNSPYMSEPRLQNLFNESTIGGVIEAATDACSHNLQARLNALGIPAIYDFTATGTHSWGYWHDALLRSWPVLAKGLGLPA
ncbi:alpha/beta hydrolase [Nocardia terpenica]|uniref:Esterase n=1 Tax=Nocardia terpenica TaxID=455432 RepID=A0A164IYF0_9NOCA|nr:alpha/beta hydrolase family protein [Nocardia terpenica]KZM69859.1 esterase [Nocardia terpenica]NQE91216.1 esterase family protein [Nocardia terpenica]